MASVQELLAAAEAQKSPLVSLLEGTAQGFGANQMQNPVTFKSLMEMDQLKQQKQRQAEMDKEVKQQLQAQSEASTQQRFKAAAGGAPVVMPPQKLKQVISQDEHGNYSRKFETVETPASETKKYQTERYQDAKGRTRIGSYDPVNRKLIQSADDALAPAAAASGDDAAALMKVFIDRSEVKEFVTIDTTVRSMDSLLKGALSGDIRNKAALDQSLITMYNKLTDPASVVRESEYARTAENLPTINRIVGALGKVQAGGAGLTDDDRQALVLGAKIIANERGRTFSQRKSKYDRLAKKRGMDPELITGTIDDFTPYSLEGAKAPMKEGRWLVEPL